MKTTLIIPSTPEHYLGIMPILESYLNGSTKPDEVIISLSEANRLTPQHNQIEQNMPPDVIMLKHDSIMHAGDNRQAARDCSTGDIIIYADADDIAHPDKIRIIKHVFESTNAIHINHTYTGPWKEFKKIDINNPRVHKYHHRRYALKDGVLTPMFGHLYGSRFNLACGHPAVLKEVDIKWTSDRIGEDVQFCFSTYFKYNRSYIINEPLIKYSNSLPEHMLNSDEGDVF